MSKVRELVVWSDQTEKTILEPFEVARLSASGGGDFVGPKSGKKHTLDGSEIPNNHRLDV